jgi:hypothetical protein
MNTNGVADVYIVHVLRGNEDILFLVRGISGVDLEVELAKQLRQEE